MWLYVCQFPCNLVQFGNLHHNYSNKKANKTTVQKRHQEQHFWFNLLFFVHCKAVFSTLGWAAWSHRAMLMRLEGGVIQGNKKGKSKSIKKKTLWHQKSQKEQRAPSNSSSLKLEQIVVWLLVWLLILVNTLFQCNCLFKNGSVENPSPLSVISFFLDYVINRERGEPPFHWRALLVNQRQAQGNETGRSMNWEK